MKNGVRKTMYEREIKVKEKEQVERTFYAILLSLFRPVPTVKIREVKGERGVWETVVK